MVNLKLYVAEFSNHRISVFQLDGQFSHIIGSGHLSNPDYIAVSTNDQLVTNIIWVITVSPCLHWTVTMWASLAHKALVGDS